MKRKLASYTVLFCFAVLTLTPMLFMVLSSFFDLRELSANYGNLAAGGNIHFSLVPKQATLAGYAETLLLTPEYLLKFWTSLLLASAIVSGQIVVSCLGGYGFAKFKFPLRDQLLFLIIVLMMLPVQVSLVPQYLVLDRLGVLGSYWSLILPGWFGAFGIFLMTQVMVQFPNEVLESAKVDGAGPLRVLLSVVLPNCSSGVGSLAVLSFIDNWNMVEQPLVFLGDYRKYPLSVFLSYISAADISKAFICGILSMLPPLLLFLFLKDEMVKGIEYANMK